MFNGRQENNIDLNSLVLEVSIGLFLSHFVRFVERSEHALILTERAI